MNWQSLTVEQYQHIHKISSSSIPDEEKSTKYLSILLDKTEKEIEELSIPVYSKHCRELAALFLQDIPGKPQRYIKADGLYRVNYEVSTMRFAQYAEIKTFLQGGVVENLHLIMASVVDPVIDYIIWRKPLKNSSKDHEKRATALLQAKFVDCYHTALFFYQFYKNSMLAMKPYLEAEMMKKMTKEQAAEVLETALDGFTMQPK
jgi:hypothetical protein